MQSAALAWRRGRWERSLEAFRTTVQGRSIPLPAAGHASESPRTSYWPISRSAGGVIARRAALPNAWTIIGGSRPLAHDDLSERRRVPGAHLLFSATCSRALRRLRGSRRRDAGSCGRRFLRACQMKRGRCQMQAKTLAASDPPAVTSMRSAWAVHAGYGGWRRRAHVRSAKLTG